jgi:hypothetical protein
MEYPYNADPWSRRHRREHCQGHNEIASRNRGGRYGSRGFSDPTQGALCLNRVNWRPNETTHTGRKR